jgi:glycosyltransferase involved in cell wall biosynthesis
MWAPASNFLHLNKLTKKVRRLLVHSAVHRLKMGQPVVWLSLPSMIDLVKDLPFARLFVYHVVDEYASYYGLSPDAKRQTEELEKKMMVTADIVIVVSKKLYETKRPFNPRTYLVPNGVDYEAYTAALDSTKIPDSLHAIKPPRLGYSGLIGDRLNFEMLTDLAQRNPQWSLVFLGQVLLSRMRHAWQALSSLPNVHYLGQVPPGQVPHFLKGFQVGLMPYLQDRHSEYISPLKLYDYMAAGLPVVSVDIPAAREFSQHIHLAESPGDFPQKVRAALADTSPDRRLARRAIAAEHTWEARTEQISKIIRAHITEKAALQRRPA